jgi:hypothetical protein
MRRFMNVDDDVAPVRKGIIIARARQRLSVECIRSNLPVIRLWSVQKTLLTMLRLCPAGLAAGGLFLFLAQVAQADLVVTVEAPGVQTSSALNTTTIDFNSVSTGYKGLQMFSLPGPLTATYVGNQFVIPADQYGGAGGVGNYLSIQANNSVTLSLSTPQAYFGLWLSAADNSNQIEFFNGSQMVGFFSAAGPLMSSLPTAYLGNPNSQFLGDDATEKFAFINFYAPGTSDMFNEIVFTNLPGATNFESDNHTFSATLQAPSAVPEPSSLVYGASAVILLSGFWLLKKSRVHAII